MTSIKACVVFRRDDVRKGGNCAQAWLGLGQRVYLFFGRSRNNAPVHRRLSYSLDSAFCPPTATVICRTSVGRESIY